MIFKKRYSAIVASLDSISGRPRDTGGKATIYLRSLDGEFFCLGNST